MSKWRDKNIRFVLLHVTFLWSKLFKRACETDLTNPIAAVLNRLDLLNQLRIIHMYWLSQPILLVKKIFIEKSVNKFFN